MPDKVTHPPACNGVLVLDKPPGPTSHDMVLRLRRKLPGHRIGHLGTLDPFATGVLPLCVGRATRLAQYLGEGDKTYDAVVHFGFSTDTGDFTGQPLGPPVAVQLDPLLIESHLGRFRGEVLQQTPSYSARKVQGVPLYRYARQGIPVQVDARRVRIHELELRKVDGCQCHLRICCSPGTYIRAIAADLGAALGCGAHLVALRRTAAGAFSLHQAVTAEELESGAGLVQWIERLIPMEQLLAGFPRVVLSEEHLRRIASGSAITVASTEIIAAPSSPAGGRASECLRLFTAQGRLAALARAGSPAAAEAIEIQPFAVLL